MSLNARRIREDFPIFERPARGQRLVFLDSAASSQKPRQVIDAVADFYRYSYANIHRGVYELSQTSTDRFEEARQRMAQFFGARTGQYVTVFTKGTTEGLNLLAFAFGRGVLGPGDEILLTEMEHHANLVPWQEVAHHTGARLRFGRVNDDGRLDLEHFYDQVNEHTRIASFAHASNVLGSVNPVREMVARLKELDIVTVIDGAQAAPGMPVDVSEIGCTAYALSAHKMLGPTGIGALFLERDFARNLPPWQTGGGMIRRVRFERSSFAPPPERFEPGTPPIAQAAAIPAMLDYLDNLGMENIRLHEEELTDYMLQRLGRIEGVRLHGPKESTNRLGVVSFDLGVHAHDLGMFLDYQGVCVRVGHHCAQPLMTRLGTHATTRASVYVYNDREDVDRLADSVEEAREYFLEDGRTPCPVPLEEPC